MTDIGRRDYATRRASRIARLEARAERARAEGESRLAQANRIANMIPMGQPILVGHHSERRHRRDVDRISRNMSTGVAALKKADVLERRAASAESNTAISSDDPEALTKLREKVEQVTKLRNIMKHCNEIIRQHAKAGPDEQVAGLVALGYFGEERARQLLKPDFCGRIGFAPFELTNSGAELRRLKGRIAELEARAAAPERAAETIGEATVDECENRVRIAFPGKPSAEVRTELKRAGFRWSPSDGVWQRHASHGAWYAARTIVGGLVR